MAMTWEEAQQGALANLMTALVELSLNGATLDSNARDDLEEVIDLLLVSHRFLVTRLRRICEHVIGRRLTLAQLPRIIQVAQILNGPDQCDLSLYIQDYVQRNVDSIMIPSQKPFSKPRASEEDRDENRFGADYRQTTARSAQGCEGSTQSAEEMQDRI